jgi:hypothetical protein
VAVSAAELSHEIPTTAKWSPHAPHDLVLIGTLSGTIAVVRLHGAQGQKEPSHTVSSLVRTGPSAILCFAWSPAPIQQEADHQSSTMFCVCAGQSLVAIYDCKQPQSPVIDLSLGGQSTC